MGGNNGILPFVFQSSGRWIGNDGNWSAFYVSVGTPSQLWHVLPSFYGQSIYVPISDDCERLGIGDCAYSRGAEEVSRTPYDGFQTNESSSWKALGIYRTDIGGNFGLTGNAEVGRDYVELSQHETGETPTVDEQIVLAFATPDLWTGLLGLSPYPVNLTDFVGPGSLSLLGKLKENSLIPSLSFGYQAGAYYRYDKTPGTLVLGGYDRARISDKAVSFPFVNDLYVGLQGMTMNSRDGNVTFLSDGILMMFDTAVPELWLPPSVCDSIASALGLTYYAPANRYVVNASTRATLRNLSPTFSFTLGRYRWGGQNVVINIPYAAFDLQAGYPIFNSTTNYFPLRRGNESQYTLGRAFLQEIYLTVDWERSTMTIGQAVFQSPMPASDVIRIDPVVVIVKNSSRPPAGTIAGAVVGSIVLVLFFALLVWCIRRRRNRRKHQPETLVIDPSEKERPGDVTEMADNRVGRELHNYHIEEMQAPHGQNELHNVGEQFDGQQAPSELASSQVHELPPSGRERPSMTS